MSRIAGMIELTVNGVLLQAKGNFTYNLGQPKNEMIVGADRVHGHKSTPQVPYIEGEITDSSDFDTEAFVNTSGATVVLSLANGKKVMLKDSVYAGDGNVQTEEANIQFRFEGTKAEEVR
jgi:hypothetical protein